MSGQPSPTTNDFSNSIDIPAVSITLINQGPGALTIVSMTAVGTCFTGNWPASIDAGASVAGLGISPSTEDYTVTWIYSPDEGSTLLEFEFQGYVGTPGGPPPAYTITPSSTGPESTKWPLGEGPNSEWNWNFYYDSHA